MRSFRLGITLSYLLLVLVTAAVPFMGGARPYAPFSVLPVPDPVTVTIVYGTEKEAWLREAAAAFESSGATVRGAPIRLELRGMGSGEAKNALRDGQIRPDVWTPASDVWFELLNAELYQRSTPPLVLLNGPDAPDSLVLTPLVLVAWEERATALGLEPETAWQDIHTAVTHPDGWSAYGHPEWGYVKLGHTSPDDSNSGLQTLLLMAYIYHSKGQGLTTADAQDGGFAEWVRELEQTAIVAQSSGLLMNDMIVYGPSRYDLVATYENLALEQIPNAQTRGRTLRMIYPPANIWSNHPYAILDAPWVTREKREAAQQFRDFLLSQPQQQRALQYGFRPVLHAISLDQPDSPFVRHAQVGVQREIPVLVETPPVDVLRALLDTWNRVAQR